MSLADLLLLEVILEVKHLLASSMPAPSILFQLSGWVHTDPHSWVIEGIGFTEVQNIEFHLEPGGGIAHFEKEPLSVAVGVHVIL